MSVVTNSVGSAVTQEFDPWGKLRSGSIGATKRNYTGQYLDDTGLLFYNARYYDPALGRFVSADSIVPGSASGGMDGVALKSLTVTFHEAGFAAGLATENQQPFWFERSSEEQGNVGSPWGPANPQALNRYTYVQNNPLRWTDPSGHFAALLAIPLLVVSAPAWVVPVAIGVGSQLLGRVFPNEATSINRGNRTAGATATPYCTAAISLRCCLAGTR